MLYRLRQLIMVDPKSHQPLDSILNGSPNPNHPWSQLPLKNHFSPLLSWKVIQLLTWLAWYLLSLLAHLFGLISLVSLARSFHWPYICCTEALFMVVIFVHISEFKIGSKTYKWRICFKLQQFDCKIYHIIQYILNLFKIGALYVPSH